MEEISSTSVAVIGLGVSGISQLRAFRQLEKQGVKIPKIVAYEKQETHGGLWNKTWKTGVDSNGDNIHSSMYNHLWSNGPKECLEFPDYTFMKHFGFPVPSYPPFSILKSYIDGYYKDSDISHWVKFGTVIRKVVYSQSTNKFTIESYNFNKNITEVTEYDYVICASGHFSTPNIVSFEGLETFTGRILHSHDFREASEFKDKDVTLIGSSYSAEDIGSQCLKYGAKSITLSYRTKPTKFDFGPKWKEVKLLNKVEGNQLLFSDGNVSKSDAIIMCTGYKHYFPFMSDNLRLNCSNLLWIKDLYNGVVFEENPKLLYLGMQDQFFTYNMFAAQAWYARDVVMGRINIPTDKAERLIQDQLWEDKFNKCNGDEDWIYFQGNYTKHLTTLTDYPNFDIIGMCKTFVDWEHYKLANPMSYRDEAHKSLIDGTMAPKLKQTWFENYNDDLEIFLKTYKDE